MCFQALLAYEAVKGCFTDDQPLFQSKDEKAKTEPKESWNIYMRRLEGANTQWYAVLTLQMFILTVFVYAKRRITFLLELTAVLFWSLLHKISTEYGKMWAAWNRSCMELGWADIGLLINRNIPVSLNISWLLLFFIKKWNRYWPLSIFYHPYFLEFCS